MGFEDNFLSGIDRKRQEQGRNVEYLDPIIPPAEARAKKLVSEHAISMHGFAETYGIPAVNEDIKEVNRLSREFHTTEPHKKYADVMEAIVFEQIEQSDWMGPNASTIKTSLYDDYKNGVDLIAEFDNGGQSLSHLGLAIDVTFGRSAIEKKFGKIRREIQGGRLTEIKYFESGNGRYKGGLKKLPRVVIGTEREAVVNLAKIWMDPSRKQEFADHPIQKVFLLEMLAQLRQFSSYALRVGQKDLVPIFEQEIATVQRILAEKTDISSDGYKDDRVFGEIQGQLDLFR